MKKVSIALLGVLCASYLGAASHNTKAGEFKASVFTEYGMATANPWTPNSDKLNGMSIGARADYMSRSFLIPELSMGISAIVAHPVISSEKYAAGYFGQSNMDSEGDSKGFFGLNELFFKFTNRNYILKALMQEIETPMVNTGDSMFLPNSYNAVMLDIFPGKVKVQAGYLMAMSGADVRSDNSDIQEKREKFHSMSKALTGNDNADDAGLWMIGAVYNPKSEPIRARAYYHMIQDFEVGNQDESYKGMYLDVRYSTLNYQPIYKKNSKGKKYLDKPRRVKFQGSAQYYTGDYSLVSSYSVFGFKASYVNSRNSPYKFTYAMNTVGGDGKGVSSFFGSRSEYTAMEQFNLSSVSAAKSAMKVNIDYYKGNRTQLNLAFATVTGDDTGSSAYGTNQHVKSGNIVDIGGKYQYNRKVSLDGVFEYQMLDGRGTKEDDVENTSVVKLSATYKF